jgi:alpha-ketoglutarate-dependent taurine dioxygenase
MGEKHSLSVPAIGGAAPVFGRRPRRPVSLDTRELVDFGAFSAEEQLPPVFRPKVDGVDLKSWAASERDLIASYLRQHGAILFRHFAVGPEDLSATVSVLGGELLPYSVQWTPRTQLADRVFTSTEYPASESIPLHNEMSYALCWPGKIFFYCAQEPATGGETPIADSRKIYRRIDPEIRERFAAKGVRYVRHYGGGIDIPWEQAFHATDRETVELAARQAGMDLEWLEGGVLRSTQVGPGVAAHHETGESVWFNQAHLFHASAASPEIRESLMARCGPDRLPRMAFYGDGTPIEDCVIKAIQEACEQEAVCFRWRQGDLLLLDNMLTAHGRRPFSGPRKIMVCMTERSGVR